MESYSEWSKWVKNELCTEILSQKIYSLEIKNPLIVLLQIMDLLNSLMLKNIFLLGVVLQAMLPHKLLTLKIWKQNTTQFVICLVWDLSFIFYWWEKVPSLVKIMIKSYLKTEPAILTSKDKSTKNWARKLLIYLRKCWKRIQNKELLPNKLYLILTFKKSIKIATWLQVWRTIIHNLIHHYLLVRIQKESNLTKKTVV